MSAEQPYPAHWEADVLLTDGRTAHLRPILPSDSTAIIAFYDGVSDRSRYLRFFSAHPRLTESDVERFTVVDYDARVALVVTLGDAIIAVAGYDVTSPKVAEVAFLVQDRHQGRGIGQLLLEHLAQAAREHGVERFEAQVLADNSRMLQVFREQGFRVSGEFAEGVVKLEFRIDPTDTAIGVMVAREHRAEAASISAFFNAQSVAVIGASRRSDTIGSVLVRNLVLGGYAGRVYAVNPAATSVSGMPAYATVGDIPGDVDVAIVAVPADAVSEVVLDCANKGVHGLIVISSGFAETGDEGRQRQRKLVGLARSYGLRLIGPNCLGVINTAAALSLNASLSPVMPPRGRAGFFCQSGALGSAILEKVRGRGLGLSTFVSAGNRADVSGNDLLQYWEEDEATEVILLYLESIGNPRKFSRIARRVSRHKPIVAVRSGRATQGVPMGHAVRSIEAPPAAVDEMFRQAGVIQVDTLDEMFDVAQFLAHQPLPRGSRVGVVGNSDALALLATDAAVGHGLSVALTVSLGPDATAEDFEHALDQAIDDEDVDSVLAVYIPPLDADGTQVATVLATVGEQSDKPIVSTFLGREGIPELLRIPDASGSTAGRGSVPSYPAVEAAVRALARVVEYGQWLERPHDDPEPMGDHDAAGASRFVTELLIKHPQGYDLTHEEVASLVGFYGIGLWGRTQVASLDEAVAALERLGGEVVLKVTDEHLRLPESAHVWRGIDDRDGMAHAWQALSDVLAHRGDEGVGAAIVVQSMAPLGVPVAVQGIEDPLFGPVVSFGLAGSLTELVGDVAYRIPPLSAYDAAAMIRSVKAAPVMFGYRGSEPVDGAAVEDIVRRIALLKNDLPQVASVSLDLVQAHANGADALRGRARVESVTDPRSEWYVRRLTAPAGTLPG
ncbi:MAG: bifunctional GNAT family N-acetyltransferase/acetate--CoA ligase family protein [Marmoricola sp.]